MKKLFLMSLLGVLSLAGKVHAQIPKGTVYVGGTVKFDGETSRSEDKSDADIFNKRGSHFVTPELQLGKFIGEHTMLGIGLKHRFAMSRTNYDPGGYKSVGTSNTISFLPFIRQYKSLGKNWSVFLHGEIGPQFQWNKSKETNDAETRTIKEDFWQYGLSINPGVVYVFPKSGWAIEGYASILSLNANYLPFKDKVGSYFTLNTGISTGFPSFFTLRVAKYISAKN
ncbi:hypothetical protein [Dyadobacter sp. CY323]|uniref:hypothetical protein n=1 Tax=Dyadobacter sp. CY323 TaxID=2907302 RepID=UPI001F26BDB6|nr:hypothetical protein [Dyadobacter sp. CY323]MCE6992385.1 hypothetical protein [Dyadobacter sp. CY323]